MKINDRGIAEFYWHGRSERINPAWRKRLQMILDACDHEPCSPADLQGQFGFHALHGNREGHFAMKLTGNQRVVLTFDNDEAVILRIADYH